LGIATIIDIYEGETVVIKENNFLGTFVLTGIPPLWTGIPKIGVTFDLDANGILDVAATDQGGGHSRDITIRHDEENLSREDGFGSGTIQKGRRKAEGPGGSEERLGK
jgi:molecular chaperone DnaK (HSP70)